MPEDEEATRKFGVWCCSLCKSVRAKRRREERAITDAEKCVGRKVSDGFEKTCLTLSESSIMPIVSKAHTGRIAVVPSRPGLLGDLAAGSTNVAPETYISGHSQITITVACAIVSRARS